MGLLGHGRQPVRLRSPPAGPDPPDGTIKDSLDMPAPPDEFANKGFQRARVATCRARTNPQRMILLYLATERSVAEVLESLSRIRHI